MNRLQGKVALITGASRGIGHGIALCMARDGADVVVNYRTHEDEALAVAREITDMGRRALVLQADVGQREAQERMFDEAVSYFNHLDIVVANAAFVKEATVLDAEWEDILRTIQVTQLGMYSTCQLAARQMVAQSEQGRRGGKIIIIGSVQEDFASIGSAPYSMSKAAVSQLCRVMAVELAAYHINVNTINPGWIDTPGERDLRGDKKIDEGGSMVPWGRMGTPTEIGEAAVFLASEAAEYVTGASLRVDGGYIVGLRAVSATGTV